MTGWLQSHWQNGALYLAIMLAMRLMYWAGIRKGRQAESIDNLTRKLREMERK